MHTERTDLNKVPEENDLIRVKISILKGRIGSGLGQWNPEGWIGSGLRQRSLPEEQIGSGLGRWNPEGRIESDFRQLSLRDGLDQG